MKAERRIDNEVAFVAERGRAAGQACDRVAELFPQRAEAAEECFRDLEHAMRQAFPDLIKRDADTQPYGDKANAAVREFIQRLRGLSRR